MQNTYVYKLKLITFLFSVTNATNFGHTKKGKKITHMLGKPKQQGVSIQLYLSQIKAMLYKKYLQNRRRFNVVLAQILVPTLMIAGFMYGGRYLMGTRNQPPLPMSLDPYKRQDPIIMLADQTLSVNQLYRNIVKQYKKLVIDEGVQLMEVYDINRYIESMPPSGMSTFNKRHIFGAKIEGGSAARMLTAMFNNEYYHTAPASLNLLYNAYVKALGCEKCSILVTNWPLPFDTISNINQLSKGGTVGFHLVSAMGYAMTFAAAFYITSCIKERTTRAKLLQLVSGVNHWIYWLTNFFWDYISFFFISVIILFTMAVYEEHGWTTADDITRMTILFMCFIFALLPWLYITSLVYATPTAGYICTFQMGLFFGNALHYVIMALRWMNMPRDANIFTAICIIVPFFAFVNGLNNLNNLNSYLPVSYWKIFATMSSDLICF